MNLGEQIEARFKQGLKHGTTVNSYALLENGVKVEQLKVSSYVHKGRKTHCKHLKTDNFENIQELRGQRFEENKRNYLTAHCGLNGRFTTVIFEICQ